LSWIKNLSFGFLAFFFLASVVGAQTKPQPADIEVVNARIYTVDAAKPWAEAVAIRAGKIVAVGSASDLEKFRGPSTKVIDAGSRLILPGFTDSHIHFL